MLALRERKQRMTTKDENFDEHGLLRDGRSTRVGMMMRDSLSPADERVTIVDAFGNGGAALHRPGARYAVRGGAFTLRTRATRPTSSTTPRRRGGGGRATTARSRSSTSPVTPFSTRTWLVTSTTPTRGAS
jgi:hypothetical protein